MTLLFASLFWGALARPQEQPATRKLIPVGAYRLYCELRGKGAPTVVIEPGVGETFRSWAPVIDELSPVTSVLVYDRAGYGQSEMGPLPRDVRTEAAELRALIRGAGVSGRCVIVGHSLGGLIAQVFAGAYPSEVAGLVLVDPPPRGWMAGQAFSGLREMFDRAAGDLAKAAQAAGRSSREEERRQAPFLKTIAFEHAEMFGSTAKQVLGITSFGDLPMVVIGAGRPTPEFGKDAEAYRKYWNEESRALARMSSKGEFVFAENSSHHVNLDDPAAIVEAVKKLLRPLEKKGTFKRETSS